VTRPFLLVGLTGGIATGKSTVSAMFRALGCVVIDADQLARDVVEPGTPAHRQIVDEFGPGVLAAGGTLDRKALGAIVFADPARRKRLEEITHPAIRTLLLERVQALTAEGFAGLVFFDAALLIEGGSYRTMERLVVVYADERTQLTRLMARDGIGREEARLKIRSQMRVADKARLADHVLDNSGDRAATEAQVHRTHAALLADLAARRGAAVPGA
jgi:dephospho-CoA kinase